MQETWVKLYRKLADHQIIRDSTALQIFIWVLLSVDQTGKMVCGRFWASEKLGLCTSTFYKAIKRLEKKYDLVTLSSNNKNTIILVKNWNKYQSDGVSYGNNKVTTGEQQSNTIQEERIKNIYISNESSIFSYFGDLKEDNKKIVDIATEFDIRPKDVIYCVRDMLSKSSEKNVEIKNVKAKLNTWINNSIRWHKVATITAKEQDIKPVKRYKDDIDYWMKEEGIRIITGKRKDATKN